MTKITNQEKNHLDINETFNDKQRLISNINLILSKSDENNFKLFYKILKIIIE